MRNAMERLEAAEACLPPVEALRAKCLELGLIMRRMPSGEVTHTAVSLLPAPVSRGALRVLQERQLLWNEAVDRTARNFAFLHAAMRETAASDAAFTGRLLQILTEVYLQPPHGTGATAPVYQPLMLGIFRTDYMESIDPAQQDNNNNNNNNKVEADEESAAALARRWKNVEINTISCSFAGLSPLVVQLHRYLQLHYAAQRSYAECMRDKGDASTADKRDGDGVADRIAQSESGECVPAALARAVQAWQEAVVDYRNNQHWTSLQPVVLVVVQENERNTADQYKLLFRLLEAHGVLSVRRTLQEVHTSLELWPAVGADGTPVAPFAVLEQKYLVAVAYFRSTYVPSDFPGEGCWQARLELERSNAIKCPSIPYHIMTFKKMQQQLTNVDEVLVPISFAGDVGKAKTLSEHFMDQYSLNVDEYGSDGATSRMMDHVRDDTGAVVRDPELLVRDAIAHPDHYVLKPQLEGGGNLIAGEAMRRVLAETTPDMPLYTHIRKEYILMRKIHYGTHVVLLLRDGVIHRVERACSELGIYGVVLSDGHESSSLGFTQPAGYLVRTKSAEMEDGGVMAGVACLDCALLTP